MDVLVVGGGGREHALVWALDRSPSVDKIYCAPGNAGIAQIAECWNIMPGDLQGLARAADQHAVDLVVVGPEAPLTSGIAAVLEQVDIACFGPTAAAAILEGSKAFAKSFMARHDIPTPAFRVFHDLTPAVEFARASEWGFPTVVKADGLAAGKGVIMCGDPDEAERAVRLCMEEGAFGVAGSTVVVEQCLRGAEATVMALTDGERLVVLPPSQDHKQAYDGDKGPNTGGMGAVAPADALAAALGGQRIGEPRAGGQELAEGPVTHRSVGRLDDQGQRLPHDGKQAGHLRIRGPWIASGYYRSEGGDVLDEEGYFPTGDIANIDGDGYMQLVDRAKDVIKSGGEWIPSLDLENAAYSHPGVAEAAVVAMVDDKWGEVPCAFVQLRDDGPGDERALIEFCRTHMAGFKVPKKVVFGELPKTVTGKVRKNVLRDRTGPTNNTSS